MRKEEGSGVTRGDQTLNHSASDTKYVSIKGMRTTLDLDKPVLEGLKALQKSEGRSLSQLASQLLAEALAQYRKKKAPAKKFAWKSQAMGARIEIADKEALYRVLDQTSS